MVLPSRVNEPNLRRRTCPDFDVFHWPDHFAPADVAKALSALHIATCCTHSAPGTPGQTLVRSMRRASSGGTSSLYWIDRFV